MTLNADDAYGRQTYQVIFRYNSVISKESTCQSQTLHLHTEYPIYKVLSTVASFSILNQHFIF